MLGGPIRSLYDRARRSATPRTDGGCSGTGAPRGLKPAAHFRRGIVRGHSGGAVPGLLVAGSADDTPTLCQPGAVEGSGCNPQ